MDLVSCHPFSGISDFYFNFVFIGFGCNRNHSRTGNGIMGIINEVQKNLANMVVIDHGQNVYSLAAGLATIHVRVNQRVDMGLRLGLASPPSEEGNTYFEIRVGKKPQDPLRWLQLREESP